MYKIIFSKKAVKALRTIPRSNQVRVQQTSLKLSYNPFNLDIKKLQNLSEATHRLRVGNYRLFLYIDTANKEVIIITIKRRTTQTYR